MKGAGILLVALVSLTGCASAPPATVVSPPIVGTGPDWDAIDQTVARIKARKEARRSSVTVTENVESGFFAMTDDEYAEVLEAARQEIRQANPKLAESAVEEQAAKHADAARAKADTSFTARASQSVEWKR
jgi:hypothetical protein